MADDQLRQGSLLTGKCLPAPLYVLKGALFLWSHRVLWKYAAAPLAISGVFLGVSYGILYHLFVRFVPLYSNLQWYLRIMYYLAVAAVGVLFVVLFFFLITRIASAVAAPFNDLISQKTEELVTGTFMDTPFSVVRLFKDSLRSVYHSLKILALYLALLLAALLLLLIPGIGSLLFTIAGTLLSAFMLAWEYLNYPLDRRRFSWKDKSSFFQSRLGYVMGFGLGSVVVATIPLVNLLFIPAAAVGGTLLFLDLEHEDR
jgi:CysZ protein